MEWKARLFGARRPARRRDRRLEGVERLEPRAMLAAFTLEAENGVLTGVNRSGSVAGFSGSGYVTGFDADGDRVSWHSFSAEPGPYRMVIRFRSPFGGKGFADWSDSQCFELRLRALLCQCLAGAGC